MVETGQHTLSLCPLAEASMPLAMHGPAVRGLLPPAGGVSHACRTPHHTSSSLQSSPIPQASALLGVGLLYEGSCHRLMVETMLAEIGRRPSSGTKSTSGVCSH